MSHNCHHSCGHEHHAHSSCHDEECGCSCHECSCGCHHQHQKYSDELLDLADEAWMEVLKEKIKAEIQKHSGDHLNQLSKLVAEANHNRWTEKLKEKKSVHDFEEQLKSLMCPSKKQGK